MILVDTNLLTRLTNASHAHHATALAAIRTLTNRGERLILFPQNIYEFWAVATRKSGQSPAGENGLGMNCELAEQWVRYFLRRFTILHDMPDLLDRWRLLVTSFGIKGIKSHDARLAAAMQSYGIARLLTFNASDFQRMKVAVIDPGSV